MTKHTLVVVENVKFCVCVRLSSKNGREGWCFGGMRKRLASEEKAGDVDFSIDHKQREQGSFSLQTFWRAFRSVCVVTL